MTIVNTAKRKAVDVDNDEDLTTASSDLTNTAKRKAVDVDNDGDLTTAFSDLTNTVNDHIVRYNEFVKQIKEEFAGLRKLVDDISKFSQTVDHEEDESSDEQVSVADPSDPWTIMFRQLREYRIVHGDCKVPQTFEENPKLGRWVNNQRQAYRNTKIGKQEGKSMTPERIMKLDSIGFHWGSKFQPPKSWDDMFQQLQSYQQNMGNCNVPFNPTNPTALAKWAAYQREEYDRFRFGLDSLLSFDQIRMLNEIGFRWKGSKL